MKDTTSEVKKQTAALVCRKTVDNLLKHNFDALYCETADDAADFILRCAATAKTIGFGGSMSVSALDLNAKLSDSGAELLIHGNPDLTPDQKLRIMKRQQTCDLFIAGVNALTVNGEIVNIDGVGNRVSASIYGPAKIILVAGSNKIVHGDIADALKRIKTCSAPQNAVRLGKNTPCAKTGVCADCDSPERICNVTVILERKPSRSDITVLVVNEDLGY